MALTRWLFRLASFCTLGLLALARLRALLLVDFELLEHVGHVLSADLLHFGLAPGLLLEALLILRGVVRVEGSVIVVKCIDLLFLGALVFERHGPLYGHLEVLVVAPAAQGGVEDGGGFGCFTLGVGVGAVDGVDKLLLALGTLDAERLEGAPVT